MKTHEEIIELKRRYSEAVNLLAKAQIAAAAADKEKIDKGRVCNALRIDINQAIQSLYWGDYGLPTNFGNAVLYFDGEWYLKRDCPKERFEIQAMQAPNTPVLIAEELFHRIREVETILFLRLNAAIDSGDETVAALCREIKEVLR